MNATRPAMRWNAKDCQRQAYKHDMTLIVFAALFATLLGKHFVEKTSSAAATAQAISQSWDKSLF
eukprot:808367-Amphidinium_carterae.1